MRKGKDPDPDLWLMDPDPGGWNADPADPDPQHCQEAVSRVEMFLRKRKSEARSLILFWTGILWAVDEKGRAAAQDAVAVPPSGTVRRH
jgi:hypothetical protein